jgi:hypothetical protein
VFGLFDPAVEDKGALVATVRKFFFSFGDVVTGFVWYYIIICMGFLLPNLVLLYG